ncbi:MAG: hypothetical protein H6925_06265 [Holosporaceae bacterium]|nr:MAG: hypothetical protein H6925_06265 [Holosporaceae bacterium]
MKCIIDRATGHVGDFISLFYVLLPFALGYVGITAINSLSFRVREWILFEADACPS